MDVCFGANSGTQVGRYGISEKCQTAIPARLRLGQGPFCLAARFSSDTPTREHAAANLIA